VVALVVGGQDGARTSAREAAALLGFEVVEAADIDDALELLEEREGRVSVVLLDLDTWGAAPDARLVERVRSTSTGTDICILVVTRGAEPARIAQALIVGADDYVVEPVDAQALRSKLELIGCLN
jgi:two-component system chemotaxis response regulator CheY